MPIKEGYPRTIRFSRQGREEQHLRLSKSSKFKVSSEERFNALSVYYNIPETEIRNVASKTRDFLQYGRVAISLTQDEIGERRSYETVFRGMLENMGISCHHARALINTIQWELIRQKIGEGDPSTDWVFREERRSILNVFQERLGEKPSSSRLS